MRYWRILLSVFFSLAVAMPVRAQIVPDKVDVLVIDPGHGGKDPGCHGKTTLEKDVVLSVSKKFGNDRFIELWRRGQIANDNHADLFVSIHCNAVDNPSAKGTETWLRGSHKDAANLAEVQRENAVIYQEQNHEANYSQSWLDVVTATVHQDAGFENSIYFADELQSLYKSRIPSSPNRGIKQGGLYVLWKSARPSVLTELGFLSNPAEEKFLASEAGQNKVAQCLLDAFSKYKERIDSRVAASLASGDDSSESSVSGKEFGSSSVEAGDSEFRSESSAPDAASSSKIVFKVQIAASSRQLELKPYNFNGLSDLSRSYDASRKLYKYYYSSASSYSQIEKALQKAKKAGYGSAFIVAFEDGRSIAVDKAREKAGR